MRLIILVLCLSTALVANIIPFHFYAELESINKKFKPQGELKVLFKDKEGLLSEVLEGKHWENSYVLTNTTRRQFILEVKKNLESKGAVFLFQGEDYLFFKFYDGKTLYWGKIVYFKNKYEVQLLEEKSLKVNNPLKGIVLKNLKFDSNKATLKKGAEGEIDRIFQFLLENSTYVVEIQGHTDSSGNDKVNLILSQKRATKVKELLMQKGIDTKRIKVKGYGETMALADNSTKEGRYKNRRVELKVLSQ